MRYELLNDDPETKLIQRLLQIRNIDCDIDKFLQPSFNDFRRDPFLLHDMQKSVERIIKGMKDKEKIMIFADYDVDGITSSYCLYTFFRDYLKYKQVSIMFPHRRNDGYGIKCHHIDIMKQKGVKLIITVDNGISAIDEALHATSLGIDIIITDHHENHEQIPQAYTVINPHVSPDYHFKWLCWAWVVFKLINAILAHSTFTTQQKKDIFQNYLPILAIATVADCVPLIDENRVFVKKWLELINQGEMPHSLKNLIEQLNITGQINTFHIGFVIGPRINAWGRIDTPYDSLYSLLFSGSRQQKYLDQIEESNTQRKILQEEALKSVSKKIDVNKKILIAYDTNYHQGIIGIVAGRIAEEYNRPTLIMYVNEQEKTASWSLRAPNYFSIIQMLQDKSIAKHLQSFGGHQQAWWLTVPIDKLDKLIQALEKYAQKNVSEKDLQKTIIIDTKLYQHDMHKGDLNDIQQLAPFGIGNQEPIFLLENIQIEKIQKVGKNGNGHIKLLNKFYDQSLTTMIWNKGSEIDQFKLGMKVDLIAKIQPDTYNGWRYTEGLDFEITK